jgi:hypothetical protein
MFIKLFFSFTFRGNKAEVREMIHRTLLKMMRSTYPEPVSVFFWRTLYRLLTIIMVLFIQMIGRLSST